jgi:hypothetical protein
MIFPAAQSAVSNRESKQDRLVVARLALASFEPPQQTASLQTASLQTASLQTASLQTASLGEPLRQAYASTAPADIGMPKVAAPVAMPAAPLAPPKPKLVAKPAPQKSYALLSDVQIAGIKERLKLSSSQESYWPAVETALRAVARKIHATRKADPNAATAPIDPDAEEVQQLKSAAMPLLFQLREDQKEEVRTLARIIGLEKVAAQI